MTPCRGDVVPVPQSRVPFRAFRNFNRPELRAIAGIRHRIGKSAPELFPGDGLSRRLVRAIAEHGGLALKEVLEAFEFFDRVRRRVRRPDVADLCCGHGLVGLLFAVFEHRLVERVLLLDQRKPASAARIYAAALQVAPHIEGRVRWLEADLAEAARELTPGCAVVAVHACGGQSDRCLELALRAGGPVALMPCCHRGVGYRGPPALRRALGVGLATEVDRTYRLEAQGYRVEWSQIPAEVTPRGRILLGLPGEGR